MSEVLVNCDCWACSKAKQNMYGLFGRGQRMILCSTCGNKRCPKASNHALKCTGSNEVGQLGSVYKLPFKPEGNENE